MYSTQEAFREVARGTPAAPPHNRTFEHTARLRAKMAIAEAPAPVYVSPACAYLLPVGKESRMILYMADLNPEHAHGPRPAPERVSYAGTTKRPTSNTKRPKGTKLNRISSSQKAATC